MGELFSMPKAPNMSSVHVCKTFLSESYRPLQLKFYMETAYGWGAKIWSNGPDHMTNMVSYTHW